jgi:TonB family protein
MKFLSQFLMLYLIGWGSLFAQDFTAGINASSCEKPIYPSGSSISLEEGTVQLKFLVGMDGKIIRSAVEKSSGFVLLDEASKEGLSKCKFKPAIKDGQHVETWASLKFTWNISLDPPCVGDDTSKWTTCLGTLPIKTGNIRVVEYKNGKQVGRGIEYDNSGNVLSSGIYLEGELVSQRKGVY